MPRAGIIGLGKMGLSHCAILNAHPDVDLVGVCDVSRLVLSVLKTYAGMQTFRDYREMIEECHPDCLVVATPTSSHAEIVRYAMERGLHVFVEKPFCLNLQEGQQLVELARQRRLVNQVGYHHRFISCFAEAQRLIKAGAIGRVYHFFAEAYGQVVLNARGSTWRSKRSEGGGCLYDYASHVIDLVNFLIGQPDAVAGTVFRNIYSRDTEDAVYSTLLYKDGKSGQLAVNWSDETYRKMSTQITVWGTEGKVFADRQECRAYLRNAAGLEGLSIGWNVRYTTDLTQPVGFYLRGEEYSAQLDYFIQCVKQERSENPNSFESAMQTDTVIDRLARDASDRS